MKLKETRKKIDAIDNQILSLLAKRFRLAVQIKKIKNKFDIRIEDPQREEEVLEKVAIKAKHLHIDSNFVVKLFKTIFNESKTVQSDA